MAEQVSLKLNSALRIGFIGGAVALYLSLVGIVGTFGGRSVIDKVVSLGHTMLILTGLGTGVLAAWEIYKQPSGQLRGLPLLAGALAGLVAGSILAALIVTGSLINLRAVFLNASPALYAMLTIGRGLDGLWIPLVGGVVLGTVGALIYLLPSQVRQPLVGGSSGVLVLGLFAELLRVILAAWPGGLADASRFFFGSEGLTAKGAILTFVMISGIILVWSLRGDVVRERIHRLPTTGQTALRLTALGFACIVMLLLPVISGPFVSQVIVLVGLYALMGLGLNVTLGFAGLFDMGFVAFFAIGAYTIGLFTSFGEHGIAGWPFWAAVPVSVFAAMIAGMLLGMPVLGIRGDYLAIATMGFGEIVRLMVLSDFLRPWLGGSFGIRDIPKPWIGGLELAGPQQLYYLVVASALLVAFISRRLRDSRLGRAWMAIREDEDVAEALGINLVQTKLLAYSLGAAFAALGGAIFATMVNSVFPHSMQLLVSINVVALIIVGGMGSIPGVVVGALFLIGLPELFREFSEYRYLFYGVTLIAMMLGKPEGLWPSTVIRRELHAAGEEENITEAASPTASRSRAK